MSQDSNDVDLRRFDDDFQQAPIEERSQEVPDGKYQVTVETVELTTAKKSGNPMLKWSLRILGPHHAGRMLWRNNVLATRENIRWLKQDLHTCGLQIDKASDLPAHLNRLLDVTLEVTKRTSGDNVNVYFNRRITLEGEPGGGGGGRSLGESGLATDDDLNF